MFVQVIQGGVKDPDGLRTSLDRWITDLGPQADGWLGTTWGLYGDNEFIVLARFASADAAKRNSERPEQGTWWAEVASSLEGETRFSDYDDDDVILLGPGGSDAAGFVQVMQGRVVDVERERAMTRDFAQRPMDFRPDILGGVAAIGDDGHVRAGDLLHLRGGGTGGRAEADAAGHAGDDGAESGQHHRDQLHRPDLAAVRVCDLTCSIGRRVDRRDVLGVGRPASGGDGPRRRRRSRTALCWRGVVVLVF